MIIGSVFFQGSIGPLTATQWEELRGQHCVPGKRWYKRGSYAYRLSRPHRFATPVRYTHKHGCVTWAKMS